MIYLNSIFNIFLKGLSQNAMYNIFTKFDSDIKFMERDINVLLKF